jgi:hypothetical protein
MKTELFTSLPSGGVAALFGIMEEEPSVDSYNRELAASINKLFEQKKLDPNALEIAQFHFEGKSVGGEVIDGIRKRLPKIARMMEQDYERRVCVVSEKYYTIFRNQPEMFPLTEGDATRFLPLGTGVRPMGIRLCPDVDDPIYRAAIKNGLVSGINAKQSPTAEKSMSRRDISKKPLDKSERRSR